MKKIVPIFLILLCIGGGISFYKFKNQGVVESPADYLPANVLFSLNHKDLGGVLDEFQKTPLAEALKSIDYIKIALDIEAPIELVDKMHDLQEAFASPATKLLLEELLSKEFTLALLQDSDVVDPVRFFENNFLLICRPKHSVTLLELLSTTFSNKFSISSHQYGKYLIHKMPVEEDLTLSFVSIGSLVMIGMNERTIREGLDRYDEKSNSLKDNISYGRLRQKYNDAQLFCFFSIENIHQKLSEMLRSDDKVKKDLFLKLDNWKGFTDGAYGVWQKEMMIEKVATLYFESDQLNKYTSSLLSVKPEKDRRLHYVPNEVLMYYWTNTFDLKTLWDLYIEQAKMKSTDLEDLEEGIQNLIGIPVDELTTLFGNRFSVMVKEPSQVDFLPIPNFTVAVNFDDMEKADSTLQELLLRNEIPHNNKMHRGVEFTYWGEGLQAGLQPVYAFYEDSIYFSSSVAMLKDTLNTIKDGGGIITDEKFKLSAETLLLESNSIGYIKFDSMLDMAKELVSWGGTMLALQDRQAAHKTKIIIDGLIQPLLDGLKMYSTIATRSYVEDGEMVFESKTTITH